MLLEACITATLLFPVLTFVVLLLGAALVRWSEPLTSRLTGLALTCSWLCAMGACGLFFWHGHHPYTFSATWFRISDVNFAIGWTIDGLSLVMALLVTTVAGIVGRFSSIYMHREPGYFRFFVLLLLFVSGMLIVVTAANLDLLVIGWEMVGLSSMLLIGFFHDRSAPTKNALRAFITYRVFDLGLIFAVIALHHHSGFSEMATLHNTAANIKGSHPQTFPILSVVSFGLVFAAMGKSAQWPASGWLPWAMEGPTPSSALFYGGLSVHAGIYLLLRAAPFLSHVPWVEAWLVSVGTLTWLYGTLVGRVQSDAKTELAYAIIAQLGLMFVEIGFGLTTLATLHLISHTLLRTFQLLRAPNVLKDFQQFRLHSLNGSSTTSPNPSWRKRLYISSLERFFLDAMLERWIVHPIVSLAHALGRLENRLLWSLSRHDRVPPPDHPAVYQPDWIRSLRHKETR